MVRIAGYIDKPPINGAIDTHGAATAIGVAIIASQVNRAGFRGHGTAALQGQIIASVQVNIPATTDNSHARLYQQVIRGTVGRTAVIVIGGGFDNVTCGFNIFIDRKGAHGYGGNVAAGLKAGSAIINNPTNGHRPGIGNPGATGGRLTFKIGHLGTDRLTGLANVLSGKQVGLAGEDVAAAGPAIVNAALRGCDKGRVATAVAAGRNGIKM